MFDFIQAIFMKASYLVAGLLISVGLVSVPVPAAQLVVDGVTSTPVVEEFVSEPEIQEESDLEEEPSVIGELENQIAEAKERIDELENQLSSTAQDAETFQESEFKNPEQQEELRVFNVRAISSAYDTLFKWNTNIPSNGRVNIWSPGADMIDSASETVNTKEHEIVATTTANESYYYIVESQTDDGQIVTSNQLWLVTPLDRDSPEITSLKITRPLRRSYIEFLITTSEPVKVRIDYFFKFITTPNGGDGGSTAQSEVYNDSSIVFVETPPYGDFTSIIYKLSVIDRSDNEAHSDSESIKIKDIVVTNE